MYKLDYFHNQNKVRVLCLSITLISNLLLSGNKQLRYENSKMADSENRRQCELSIFLCFVGVDCMFGPSIM